MVKIYDDSELWLSGQIFGVTDPDSYKYYTDKDGRIFQRHQDQKSKSCISLNRVHKISNQH